VKPSVFFFDCDKTLYDYDFLKRLPNLARLTGSTQYHLASTWWVGGFERAANAGEFATGDEYLEAFAEVTGVPLTREQWCESRKSAMTIIPGSIAALKRASELGTAALLSNNPIIFREELSVLAPEAAEIIGGDNDLVSAVLGAAKPERRIYTRALGRLGVKASDAFFADDSHANVEAARAVGITAFHLTKTADGYDTDGLMAAVEEFAARP